MVKLSEFENLLKSISPNYINASKVYDVLFLKIICSCVAFGNGSRPPVFGSRFYIFVSLFWF